MPDATIIGGGAVAQSCGDVLDRAGFSVRHAFELDGRERTPVILGDLHGAINVAKQAVEAGRHLLVCNPFLLTTERLGQLIDARRKASQALFIWNERAHHPGYRFVGGLIETDQTWRPRYLRLETLSAQPTNSALARWMIVESLRLVMHVTQDAPLSVAATQAENATRNGPDLTSLLVGFKDIEAFVQVGLGEAIERQEMLLAAPHRRAFVDELNASAPVRLVDYEASQRAGAGARWLACGSPTQDEIVRQQCLSFFEATLKAAQAQAEADAWQSSLATLEGMDRSLRANGAAVSVQLREAAPRFRLIMGRHLSATPPSTVA